VPENDQFAPGDVIHGAARTSWAGFNDSIPLMSMPEATKNRFIGPGGLGSSGGEPPDRIPPLIFLITGMGMRGEMEDRLCRELARIYTPAIPIVIHRYGLIRTGALSRWRQRAAIDKLAERMRLHEDRTVDRARTRPHIVAHSFGAWLIGNVLRRNPDIRVGRIILIGSVLRPDFEWNELIAAGQVEAVLNHYGSRDYWSWVSEYFIPESGPSGFRGFAECSGVFNCMGRRFRHTTFFEERNIEDIQQSLWRPFFTLPAGKLRELTGPDVASAWRPVPWVLSANLFRLLLLMFLGTAAAGLLLIVTRLLVSLVS
jgi:pimeloyl-ACP methyl ester carboxylesterase